MAENHARFLDDGLQAPKVQDHSAVPPRRVRLTVEEVAQKIIDGIAQGLYKPMKRLGEASMAKRFKCGQALVRAAMARLAFAGVLERRHRSGTYVREITASEFVDLVQHRAVLEGFFSRLACRHIAEQNRQDLEELACQLDEQIYALRPESYTTLGPLEWKFHSTIAVLSGNSSLIRALDGQQLLF